MILDERDIENIKSFILNESTEEELEMCNKCGFTEEINEDCVYKDICARYSPIEIGDEMMELVVDLFDTIDYLIETKNKLILNSLACREEKYYGDY
jgi:hypothetical protein